MARCQRHRSVHRTSFWTVIYHGVCVENCLNCAHSFLIMLFGSFFDEHGACMLSVQNMSFLHGVMYL